MKCRVCKTEIDINLKQCQNCMFNDIRSEFINAEEAIVWMDTVVIPFREKYNSKTKPAKDMLNDILKSQIAEIQKSITAKPEFEYEIINNGVILTKYLGYNEKVNIPECIDGNSVVGLGDKLFYGCKEITEIILHDKITSIGNSAFANTNISEIIFPPKVFIVREGTCHNCKKLKTVVFSNVKIIEKNSFAGCPIDKIILPEGITGIGDRAFERPLEFGYINVELVVFPKSLNTINLSAFGYAKIKKAVFLNDSVKVSSNPSYFEGRVLLYNATLSWYDIEKIYCNSDSVGQKYARENNVAYLPLSEFKVD